MCAVTQEQPTAELATVEVSVPSSLLPSDGTGGLGRITVKVPLAPTPNTLTSGHGVAGNGFEILYRDDADVRSVEAAADARGEAFFSVPGIPGVVKITGKHPSHDGCATVFSAVDGGMTLGDETIRRQQANRNRANEERTRRENNAAAERATHAEHRKNVRAAMDVLKALDPDERREALAELKESA
jgi:hypothetical protein